MIQYRGPEGKWNPLYAYTPIRIKGKWYWLTTVYRREKNRMVYPHQDYEWGNLFDALRDA